MDISKYPRGRAKRIVIIHSGPEGDRVYIGICGTRKVFNRRELTVPEGSTAEEFARATAIEEGLTHYYAHYNNGKAQQVPV